ncbi:hypothetical protein [Faecalibacterium wellingii]|uniref:Uncharacterized protein n=1 Tax=Faecalibacterium wellingii TaxID=2929491 RepID=A0ABU3TXP8_9FIRM|nr:MULTISPECIES: hypothetical protein [Faecalibacterium]MDU8687849.1 hypothetical protein [Faecalibacterium prausnitzii]UQK56038.1 hypothetical protein MTP37_10390 [Faecalibacterium sp. HTF-F]
MFEASAGWDPSGEKGIPEKSADFQESPIKNNYSAKNAQSKAESIQMVINPD